MFIITSVNFKSCIVNYLCSVATYAGSCLLWGLEFNDTLVTECIVSRAKVLLWKTMKIGEQCEDPLKRSYRLLHPACRNSFLLLVLTWIEFVKKRLFKTRPFRAQESRAVWRQNCENKGTEILPMSVDLTKWTWDLQSLKAVCEVYKLILQQVLTWSFDFEQT